MPFFCCCGTKSTSPVSDQFELIERHQVSSRFELSLNRFKSHQIINDRVFLPIYFYRRAKDNLGPHFFQVDPLTKVVPILKLGLSLVLVLPDDNPSTSLRRDKSREIECFVVRVADANPVRITFTMVGVFRGRLQIFYLVSLRRRIDHKILPQLIQWENGHPKWVFLPYHSYKARASALLPLVDSIMSNWSRFVKTGLPALRGMETHILGTSELLQMGSVLTSISSEFFGDSVVG
ncbi:hypothetical protein QCA50_016378 [Cerrena zonata]|uniref:Maturase K n=1 Tax=Cerrena zonata TaxID=2478898 RepID=A0AAW0FT93_9APHY